MSERPAAENLAADIVVAGGGLAGLAAGLAAAKAGFETIVVDAAPLDAGLAPAFDGRVSALSPPVMAMLETLGVRRRLSGEIEPVTEIVVSDGTLSEGAAPLFLQFGARSGEGAYMEIVENRHLRRALLEACAAVPRVTLLAPATVQRTERGGAKALVFLDDGRTIECGLVIAADGRASPRREEAGIKTVSWTYGQAGIVTTVAHERPHQGTAHEYFLPAGPFAILPMTGNRSSLVWTERTEDADALMALDDEAFAFELEKRFGDHLGPLEPTGPRWSYPLSLMLARRYCGRRLALVGDAAHIIHPLAGQGLNLGLKDTAALIEVLADARHLGLDIGAPSVLARYERWRRFDNVSVAVMCDLMNRLFSNDFGPLRLVRDLGLAAVDRLGPLKEALARQAAGARGGDTPKLLRGEAL